MSSFSREFQGFLIMYRSGFSLSLLFGILWAESVHLFIGYKKFNFFSLQMESLSYFFWAYLSKVLSITWLVGEWSVGGRWVTELGLFSASWHVFFSIRQPRSHLMCLWATIFIEKRGNTIFLKKERGNKEQIGQIENKQQDDGLNPTHINNCMKCKMVFVLLYISQLKNT